MNRILILFCILCATVSSDAATDLLFSGSFDGRIAAHTRDPWGLASKRFDLRLKQEATFSKEWKGVFSASGWNDSVYAERPEIYDSSVAKYDGSDMRLRDFYLQYQHENILIRSGYQQVVWGEAFGGIFSDIINPRDLRDGGLSDLADQRLQTPMVNAKIISSALSLQAIYIPQSFYHLIPSPGNDFAFPYTSRTQNFPVDVRREKKGSWSPRNNEFGARATAFFAGWDFSAFFFNYRDRSPYFVLDEEGNIPFNIILDEKHARVRSQGATVTKDLNGYLLRAEYLVTKDRQIPSVDGFTLEAVKRDNTISVIGLDLPTWRKYNFSLQWSQDRLEGGTDDGLLRTANQETVGVRVSRTIFGDKDLELLQSYSTTDYGRKTQFKFVVPVSTESDVRIGVEYYNGTPTSDYGLYKHASRYFAIYRYQFGK